MAGTPLRKQFPEWPLSGDQSAWFPVRRQAGRSPLQEWSATVSMARRLEHRTAHAGREGPMWRGRAAQSQGVARAAGECRISRQHFSTIGLHFEPTVSFPNVSRDLSVKLYLADFWRPLPDASVEPSSLRRISDLTLRCWRRV